MRRLSLLAVLAVACGTTTSNPDGGSTPSFTVGGAILTAGSTGLVLATSGEPNFTVPSGATSWAFANALTSGTAYSVTVATQPSGQTCTLANASGTVGSANVTNVNVSCTATATACATPPCYTISVLLQSQGGGGMVVATPGEPNLTISGPGPVYAFADEVSNGTTYNVTIVSQPPAGNLGQATCTVNTGGTTPGTGTVNGANVEAGILCAIQLP